MAFGQSLHDSRVSPCFFRPAPVLPEPLPGIVPDFGFDKGCDLLNTGADIRIRIVGLGRHEGRVNRDAKAGRTGPAGRDRDDRNIIFQRQA